MRPRTHPASYSEPVTTHGLLLAAGAGRRMGTPKALVGDWLVRGIGALRDGGCVDVTVVLGAAAPEAVALLGDARVRVVVAPDWAEGMGASLRTGLATLDGTATAPVGAGEPARSAPVLDPLDGNEAALVTLVDLPDVGADVVRRVLTATRQPPGPGGGPRNRRALAATLRRASYDGVPGHPVLLGRDHWAGVAESARGDRGARAYLAAHDVELVECGDLATGHDIDSR